MADYRNCTCIACRNEFEPDDDIVVCPECGTPYHRDCWNAHGHCINTELHEKGESWHRPDIAPENDKAQEVREQVICYNCGERNDPENKHCSNCGADISRDTGSPFNGFSGAGQSSQDSDEWRSRLAGIMGAAAGADDPNEDMGGASLGDMKDFVGKNIAYYIPRFRLFRDSKRKLAPNFICFLFPEFWFAYRKMWLASAIIIILSFLFSIPGSLITLAYQTDTLLATLQPQLAMMGEGAASVLRENLLSFSSAIDANYNVLYWIDFVCSYLSLAMRIILFLFGNYIYYRHCIRKIGSVRANQKSLMDVQSRIRIAGGANIGFIFLALLAEFILTSVLAYAVIFI